MRIFTFTFFCVSLLTLAACTPVHVRLQPGENYSFTNEKPEGIVFFSTSYSGLCVPIGTIQLRAEPVSVQKSAWKGGLEDNLFMTANPFVKSDYADHYAVFHSRAWPAGEYRFFDLSFFAGPATTYSTKSKFNIPFRVVAKKALYLGRINIDFRCGGAKDLNSYQVTIHDDSSYDIPTFKQRTPKIPGGDVVVEVVKSRE